jgi:hypothetical protein
MILTAHPEAETIHPSTEVQQLTLMALAKGAAAGVMLKLTSLACPLLSLPLVSPKLSLTIMLFISDWKKLTAN